MSIDLNDELLLHGRRSAIVPFSRLEDVKQDMIDLQHGLLHVDWLDEMIEHITDDSNPFLPPDIEFEPQSLISVVSPRPKAIVSFTYQGETIDCVVPPLYTNWYLDSEETLCIVRECLAPHGHSVAMVKALPHKMVAVHAGLGAYGRNNIFYHDEFGSYVKLMTYVSDLPCGEHTWYPHRRMDQCDACQACISACPTQAIDASHQLIDFNRCLTLFNEHPGVFPQWIEKGAFSSLIGCIKCQDCCPSNSEHKKKALRGVSFTEAETHELLSCAEGEPYTDSLASKIEKMGIPQEYVAFFPRNLAALLEGR